MFAMFGATVLVPILVQGYGLPLSIQTTLFFAGFGTLFFHVCTRMKGIIVDQPIRVIVILPVAKDQSLDLRLGQVLEKPLNVRDVYKRQSPDFECRASPKEFGPVGSLGF